MADIRKSFVAKAIYGLVTVQTLLVVMQEHPPSPWSGAITLLGTTLVIALLDTYADAIGEILSMKHTVGRAELREMWHSASPVLVGAQAPTFVFLLSALGLFSVDTAIVVSQLLIVIFLFGYGLQVGRQLHTHWIRQVLSGLVLVAIGSLIIGIKVLFH